MVVPEDYDVLKIVIPDGLHEGDTYRVRFVNLATRRFGYLEQDLYIREEGE